MPTRDTENLPMTSTNTLQIELFDKNHENAYTMGYRIIGEPGVSGDWERLLVNIARRIATELRTEPIFPNIGDLGVIEIKIIPGVEPGNEVLPLISY